MVKGFWPLSRSSENTSFVGRHFENENFHHVRSFSLTHTHTHRRAQALVRKHATKCDQEKTRWRQCRRRFWASNSEHECVCVCECKENPLLAHSWTFPSRFSNTVLVLERNNNNKNGVWVQCFQFALGCPHPPSPFLLVVENRVRVPMRRHSEPYWERRGY